MRKVVKFGGSSLASAEQFKISSVLIKEENMLFRLLRANGLMEISR